MLIAIDTETYLIKGRNVPPFVCLSYAELVGAEWRAGVMRGEDARAYLERAFTTETTILHNARFDLCVIARTFPSLMPIMFTALDEGRVRDTRIREKLHKIARGGTGDGVILDEDGQSVGAKLSLGGLAFKYYQLDIRESKRGGVRYTYDELADTPLEEWGDQAINYATQDALLTGLVFHAQAHAIPSEELLDECAQVRADFALGLIGAEGMRVDPDAVGGVRAAIDAEVEELKTQLRRVGLLDARGKANTALIKDRIDLILSTRGDEVPKTSSGEISTSRDALLATGDPDLALLDQYRRAVKLGSTYVGELESAKHYDGILRAEYSVLMRTGRTSCKRPNLQNLPRRGGIRDCFIPRDGNVFILCDYDAAEMRTLAECYLYVTGEHSPLGEMYAQDPQFDPHSYLGARILGIEYEEMLQRVAEGDAEAKSMRQRAKPANFGYAGGMGASAFINYARGYGVKLSEEEASDLRDTWISTYKMRPWFKEAERAHNDGRVICPSSQRIRGNPSYTESANMPFQGMAADGAKRALFELARECWTAPESPLFGCRPVAFIHDEVLVESPKERAHEAAMRVREIMEREMMVCTPNVPASATPALATRWLKGAEPKYDERGRLIPWG